MKALALGLVLFVLYPWWWSAGVALARLLP